ncbi:YceI family protein [Deminuibacter soli]|uniref:YceI family protein n=1 Tax=Deminuibacter soli TaxID=2291815 RepID=A0A3E1NFP2_9BACT|nr:YceI family protein [Deminuibacter soli]RFM26790.1 YceI family protein [Deminuibacter soli]
MAPINWQPNAANSQVQLAVNQSSAGYIKKFDLQAKEAGQRIPHFNTIPTSYPAEGNMLFSGNCYEGAEKEGRLHGVLTINKTVRPLVVNIFFEQFCMDADRKKKTGVSVSGKINREEFDGISDMPGNAGASQVEEDVLFHGRLQLIKQTQPSGKLPVQEAVTDAEILDGINAFYFGADLW